MRRLLTTASLSSQCTIATMGVTTPLQTRCLQLTQGTRVWRHRKTKLLFVYSLSTHPCCSRLKYHYFYQQMSLFLTSLPAQATEESVRTTVLKSIPTVQPDQLKSVVHVAKSRCAFVNFKDRMSAELAAQAWANGLDIDGEVVNVKWGRSRPATGTKGTESTTAAS
jgi:hypothetical protein